MQNRICNSCATPQANAPQTTQAREAAWETGGCSYSTSAGLVFVLVGTVGSLFLLLLGLGACAWVSCVLCLVSVLSCLCLCLYLYLCYGYEYDGVLLCCGYEYDGVMGLFIWGVYVYLHVAVFC